MTRILVLILILTAFFSKGDTLCLIQKDTLEIKSIEVKKHISNHNDTLTAIYKARLSVLNDKTPMDLNYNDKVDPFIHDYLNKNKALISKMLATKALYFPLFEEHLDKYSLPLELKYLAIVESALNPKAKSGSGATGLWQFMYLTGKEYGLNVTSYIDDRQDPLKSTQAACEYFLKLYELFGDWNLVLAAYNGGPGYLQRKINNTGSYDFWDLHPYLRKETRNYIPTFIAVNYAMNYANEHNIFADTNRLQVSKTDTITIKKQVSLDVLSELICVDKETINYLNPSYKNQIFPIKSTLILPTLSVEDFLNNEISNYNFIELVEKKEILIDEERIVHVIRSGDYLGKIAKEYNVRVFELKKWNNLRSTLLDIGDELIVYVKKDQNHIEADSKISKNEYIIQKGDTLWDIAQKHKGISIWKIKSLNNLENDNLKPGTKLILPST